MQSKLSSMLGSYRKHGGVGSSSAIRLALLSSDRRINSVVSSGLSYFCHLFGIVSDLVPEAGRWDQELGVDLASKDYLYKKFYRQKELEASYPNNLEVTVYQAPLVNFAIQSSLWRGDKHPITEDLIKLAKENKNNYTHFVMYGCDQFQSEDQKIREKTVEVMEALEINYTVINSCLDSSALEVLHLIGAISPVTDQQGPVSPSHSDAKLFPSYKDVMQEMDPFEDLPGKVGTSESSGCSTQDNWPLGFLH